MGQQQLQGLRGKGCEGLFALQLAAEGVALLLTGFSLGTFSHVSLVHSLEIGSLHSGMFHVREGELLRGCVPAG